MEKLEPHWRAELMLTTIKFVFKEEKMFGVVEPFYLHQMKNTVANDDFERRKDKQPSVFVTANPVSSAAPFGTISF